MAVKVIRSIKKYIESAQIEADILDDVFEQQKRLEVEFCVKMYASFRFDGNIITRSLNWTPKTLRNTARDCYHFSCET